MRPLILIVFLTFGLFAKEITPNDVYAQVMLISEEMHFLLKHYGIEHDHEKEKKRIKTQLKPRNVWQLTYEITVKMNMLRTSNDLPMIEPVNMEPVLHLNPDLVFEQTQRILTEIRIFKLRMGIKNSDIPKVEVYHNKTPLDVYNALSNISSAFDKLNRSGFTPSYVFGETMRIYDDLTTILNHMGITDNSVPTVRNDNATPSDTFHAAMVILDNIKQVQYSVGIATVDFSVFAKKNPTPSDVFTITQMILAELQTLKAYAGLLHYITPAAAIYTGKTPADVDQLMNWNLRKITLIHELRGRVK